MQAAVHACCFGSPAQTLGAGISRKGQDRRIVLNNMKSIKNWLLIGVMLICGCAIGNAQIIYSNVFNGQAVTLDGTAPTVANSLLGGLNNALWNCTFTNGVSSSLNGTVLANGTIGTNAGCVLLPFTPESGAVYYLTASLTVPSPMSQWVAMGFSQLNTQTNNTGFARFNDNPGPQGYAWMDPREGVTQNLFGGPGASIAATPAVNGLPGAGSYMLEIVLNTAGTHWTVSAYVNGTIVGTNIVGGTQIGTNLVYGANPPIAFAGIGQNSFAGLSTSGIQWNYWALSVVRVPTMTSSYWVAPAAAGTGDGSSAANAAGYLSPGFWSAVQNQLQSANVSISLVNGNYNAGTLSLVNLGNPLHRLSLQAVNLYGPVFSTTSNDIVNITGSQNIEFYGLLFNGSCSSWGIDCEPNYLNPCRNLEFSHCELLNLTNAYYGALGLVNGPRDITVDNCTFTNITNGDHAHMIYASHDLVGLVVTNCLFQDCLADYVRLRDDSEYCVVDNCTFISTESASAWPFVSVELYNDTDPGPGDEFFGNYFQIVGNSFTFKVSGGPGPYSALHFSDSGYSPQSYDCDLTSAQAGQLSGETTSFQQSFLQTNMGIIASAIKMFGNIYGSKVAYYVDYAYSWDDTNAPYGGWQGTINLSTVPDASGALLGPPPVVRNGNFDEQGLLELPQTSSTPNECLFQKWFCNPKYADILSHPGFNGTTNAVRLNPTNNLYIYQWISNPTPAWTMDFLFAIGSAFTGTGTKFKVDIFHDDIVGSKVSVGVDNLGRFGIYNGSTFTILPELGTVAFSVDKNGNGLYTDPGDTLNVYHLRMVGNYSGSTPYVNIYTSDANNLTVNHQALGLTSWVSGAPTGGQSAPETIAFYNYTAPVVLDQIALGTGLEDQPPVITSTSVGGGQVVFSGTNDFAGATYFVLSSTNLALPVANWTYEATNTYSDNSFSFTNPVSAGSAQKFYLLKLQ
jgi:hypothetical protein